MLFHLLFLVLCILLSTSSYSEVNASDSARHGIFAHLRIEGSNSTIFEGRIFTTGHNISTPSGGTHECNGLNNHSNPVAGPTATSALADAAHRFDFPFDGTFFDDFDDFLITSIGPDTQTSSKFWGLLIDFTFTAVGGCQQEVLPSNYILWAFDAFNANAFLKLDGPDTVPRGQDFVVTVTDGASGKPVNGAVVGGLTTDISGHATIRLQNRGVKEFKATKELAIRSNGLHVIVL